VAPAAAAEAATAVRNLKNEVRAGQGASGAGGVVCSFSYSRTAAPTAAAASAANALSSEWHCAGTGTAQQLWAELGCQLLPVHTAHQLTRGRKERVPLQQQLQETTDQLLVIS
jgi:hypothetical protein